MSDDELAIIDKLIYLSQGKSILNKDGEPLTSIGNGKYVVAVNGDEIAREKSPLQLLLENESKLKNLTKFIWLN